MCFTGLIFCYLAQAEKEEAHLQLEIIYQIWPRTKFWLMVIGKVICCMYCAFVIYSEYLLIPPISKLTTAAVSYTHLIWRTPKSGSWDTLFNWGCPEICWAGCSTAWGSLLTAAQPLSLIHI